MAIVKTAPSNSASANYQRPRKPYAGKHSQEYHQRALYLGLHENGDYYFGSQWQHKFRPGGSRVKFCELPIGCQESVREIYKKFWEEGYFIMA